MIVLVTWEGDRTVKQNAAPSFLSGRECTAQEIQQIQETVRVYWRLSWHELVQTICEHLDSVTPAGRYKVDSCVKAQAGDLGMGAVAVAACLQGKRAGDVPRGEERSAGGDRGDGAGCGAGGFGAGSREGTARRDAFRFPLREPSVMEFSVEDRA